VTSLRKKRRAATDRPRASATNKASATNSAGAAATGRHVPAALKRALWQRDQGRCSYLDARGCRCPETGGLEIHHDQPFAKGGAMTLDNLALRCRPHNDLAAEQDFGRELIERKKRQARRRREKPKSAPPRPSSNGNSRAGADQVVTRDTGGFG
jgi:5-methylcytosine-specific restriction endonuclease McrA